MIFDNTQALVYAKDQTTKDFLIHRKKKSKLKKDKRKKKNVVCADF